MGNRSVSLLRSSNRTCGFPASGFPTGFIAKPTAATFDASVSVGGRQALRRFWLGRSLARLCSASYAVWRGSGAHDRRRGGRLPGRPARANRSRSRLPNPTAAGSGVCIQSAMLPFRRAARDRGPSSSNVARSSWKGSRPDTGSRPVCCDAGRTRSRESQSVPFGRPSARSWPR